MSKSPEQIHTDFEAFKKWVNEEMGMNPTCIWCPKAARAYFFRRHIDAKEIMEKNCADCRFCRKAV